ncbi:hypothetical protein KCP69_00005 [Salmonella enterica subsp. enterica]|nr:hypothetical protein KCP69_00005 [Salmonella enterica subsp. enterica]
MYFIQAFLPIRYLLRHGGKLGLLPQLKFPASTRLCLVRPPSSPVKGFAPASKARWISPKVWRHSCGNARHGATITGWSITGCCNGGGKWQVTQGAAEARLSVTPPLKVAGGGRQ